MRFHFLIGLFSLQILFFSCSKSDSNNHAVKGDSATIAYNETVTFSDHRLTVTFTDILDSRCPCDAACLIPGYTDVFLEITDGDKSEDITLQSTEDIAANGTMNGNISDNKEVVGKTVTLQKVRPELCGSFEVEDYEITLEIQ